MITSAKSFSIVNLIYIFLSINYTIIVDFITHIDSAGYLLVGLSIIVLILNYKKINKLQLRKPIVFWFIWCMFAIFNYWIHPHVYTIGFIILLRLVFVPLITMLLVVIEFRDNPITVLWLCLVAHIIYAIGGFYFDPGNLFIGSGEEGVLGNIYAITSCFVLFYLTILNRMKRISTVWFAFISIIVILLLAMSGTRKAFGAGFIFLFFWVISLFNIRKTKTWIIVILLLVVGLYGYQYLLDNTFMGERMEFLESQMEEQLPAGAPKFLSLFGDRASHYYYGIMQFSDHPILGVGLKQARVNNAAVYFHSEPMAQLTDNGIIGFILMFLFYYWICSNVLRKAKKFKEVGFCMLGGVFGLLFLMLTTWLWEFPTFFICLGVLIGFSNAELNRSLLCS